MRIENSVLEMALVGYQAELNKIEEKMADIRRQLGGRVSHNATPIRADEANPKRKRNLSAAARRRIGAAQRKRWQAFHAQQNGAAKPKAAVEVAKAAPKRKLSPAARAKLVANLAKARAAKAAKATSA
jgi:hypothetical protein